MTYALITGASSGIGLELASLFAANGKPLILTARRHDKLQQVAANLRSNHSVDVRVIPADLANAESIKQLCEAIYTEKLIVSVLVNNAGFGSVGKFSTIGDAKQSEMLAVNVVALTILTRKFLPAMIENKSGGILNVASVAAYQPGPYMAVYYATKAYVLSFSEALREELRGTGVSVTCLLPGPTESEFGSVSGLDQFRFFTTGALSANRVAQLGYQAFQKQKATAIPGIRNKFMVSIVKHLPHSLTSKFVARIQQPRSP